MDRAEKRYWDGSEWTDWVSDDGEMRREVVASLPPPPAEPLPTARPLAPSNFAVGVSGAGQRELSSTKSVWARIGDVLAAVLIALWHWVRASRRNRVIAGIAAVVLIAATQAGGDDTEQPQSDVAAVARVAEPTIVPGTTASPTVAPSVVATTEVIETTVAATTTTEAGVDAAFAGAIGAQLLEQLVVGELDESVAYVRFDYQGDGWSDFDGDCQSTRHEELLTESLIEATVTDDTCFVEAGLWIDPWSGEELTDASEATIDHMIPLSHAHEVGASQWDFDTKSRFTNDDDPAALNAVSQSTNSSKGGSSPADWRPPERSSWCGYAIDWVHLKLRWQLWVTAPEKAALLEMLGTCAEPDTTGPVQRLTVGGSVLDATIATLPPPTTAPPTTAPPPPLAVAPPAEDRSGCHSSYPTVCIPPKPPDLNCGDIPFKRFTVVGSDPHGFDGDNDGVGCES